MIGQVINEAIARAIVVLAVLAFSFGALAMWGIPKLWELLKPFIHMVTA